MNQDQEEQEFLKHLRDEKLKTQERRTTYTLRKFAFTIGLIGVGSIGTIGTQRGIVYSPLYLLYIVPFVSLGFDLYILAEDYSVKRIGAFLKHKGSPREGEWEKWVATNRDPFAPFSISLLTTLVLIASGIIIGAEDRSVVFNIFFWIWIIINIVTNWGLFFLYRHIRGSKLKETERDLIEHQSN